MYKTTKLFHKGSLSQWNVTMGFHYSKKVEKHWYIVISVGKCVELQIASKVGGQRCLSPFLTYLMYNALHSVGVSPTIHTIFVLLHFIELTQKGAESVFAPVTYTGKKYSPEYHF